MADRYVRKSGSDSNGGTGPSDAWLTIGKALGVSGAASGDVIYVGAGIYREVITVGLTPAAETKVIGDVDGVKTGDAGEVVLTAFTTNDTTTPSGSFLISGGSTNYYTWERFVFVTGSNYIVSGMGTNWTWRDCLFHINRTSVTAINHALTEHVAYHWLFERCVFTGTATKMITLNINTSTTAPDWDVDVVFRNCLFLSASYNTVSGITIAGGFTNAYKGGGVCFINCTIISASDARSIEANNTYISTTYPVVVRNCLLVGGLFSSTLGALTSDYNRIIASSSYTNVTAGANDVTTMHDHRWSLGAEYMRGAAIRPFGEPAFAGSPLLGRGSDGTYNATDDIRGNPRPAGGASASKAVGAYERGNSGTREGTTIHAGSSSVKLLGPGYQDFEVAVPQASTTIGVYVQWDATYAGTKPSMSVLKGGEAGVSDATATATGSSGSWEQLTLTFTPTSAGIVTVRLTSSDTNGGGAAYFDDLTVT